MAKKNKRKKTAGDYILTLILIAAICVFIYAAFNLFQIWQEYKKGTDEYNAIEEMAVTEREPDQQNEEKSQGEEELIPPITVDFDALKKVNEDVIGWIYVEALDISYPVVKGKDNDYYLHRTYEGTYNFAGTIFVDYENSSDFNDCNTIVYGHNMKNGSMFGTLSKFVKENAYEKSHYFWMLTPEKNYKYEIFAAYTTGKTSDTYTLFKGPGEEFEQYAEKMKQNSEITVDNVTVGIKDKIMTLSTCTGNDATRFVVQGKRMN